MKELFDIIQKILDDPATEREYQEWEENNGTVNADPGD